MFTLVLAIISIALIVATILVGSFYGGSQLSEVDAMTEAIQLRNEEQQIMAAVDMFNADKGHFPSELSELVEGRYLRSLPAGGVKSKSPGVQAHLTLVPLAHADSDVGVGWSAPVAGQPIILTGAQVRKEVCRKYNQVSRGDDGILKNVLATLPAQCYGTAGVYRVVVSKGTVAALTIAVAPAEVLTGAMPATTTGDLWWDVVPKGAIKGEIDPEKVPYAKLVLTPSTSENFGSLQVGQSVLSGARTLTNSGNIAAASVTVEAPEGVSLSENTCSGGLAPKSSCSFAMQFSPSQAKHYDGSVTVGSGNAGALSVAITGDGQGASAIFSSVKFGNVAAGARVAHDALLENRGIGPLTLASPEVTGSGFLLVSGGTCANSLPAGASCSIRVQLLAAGQTDHIGTLTVRTAEAGELSASLTGLSQQAVMTIAPTTHAFGSVQVGQAQDSLLSTVRNTGNIDLTGLAVRVGGPFTRAINTCSTTLAPGAACELSFRFTPTEPINYSEPIQVTANGVGAGTVTLTGKGASADATLTGGAFGEAAAGSSVDQVLTLRNTGVGPLALTVPSTASLTGAGFTFQGTTCLSTLPAGQACTVSLRFTATGVAAAAGTLTINTSAGAKSVSLSGQSQNAILAVSPTSHAFGNVQVGATGISGVHTLVNNGNTPITGLALRPPEGYTINSSTCLSTTLAASASCTFKIVYAPTGAAPNNSSVAITASNAVGVSVNVTGSGVAQSGTLTGIAFGGRASGSATDLASTLTNTGLGPLSITPPGASSVVGTGFSFVNTNCGASLAPGASCTTVVRYSAKAWPPANGTLTIATGAGVKSAALTGQSLGSFAALLTPTTISIADWYQAGNITTAVIFRNDGNAAMTLNGSGLWGALSLLGNTCTNVAPGVSCTMTVALNRGATPGSGQQALAITGATEGSQSVTVNWFIYSAVPRWSTTSLQFGNVTVGSAASQTLNLHNDGTVAYNWTGAGALANVPAGFSFNTNACSNVAPGGSCPVTVTFAPTAATGYGGAWIQMVAASYPTNTLSVAGTGLSAVVPVNANQFSLVGPYGGGDDFYVHIVNNSGQNLTVTAITFHGSFDEYVYAVVGGQQFGHTYNTYEWCCQFYGNAGWSAGAAARVYFDIQTGSTSMSVTFSNGQTIGLYIPQAN